MTASLFDQSVTRSTASPPGRDVLISNGLNRSHLAVAATEVDDAGRLGLLLTGAYPTATLQRFARRVRLTRSPRIARLVDRPGGVPDERIEAMWLAEALWQLGIELRERGARSFGERLMAWSFRSFARGADRRLRRSSFSPTVYHYRSGFGGRSVSTMRARGATALCDHSIAHPAAFGELLAQPRLARHWELVLRDLDQADQVVVNSDFVKQTFVDNGWTSERIHVLYLGVDDAFLMRVREPAAREPGHELRMLFAGSLDARKGAADLEAALLGLDDVPWRLAVAGPVPAETLRAHRRLLSDGRVSLLGNLSRAQLADAMTSADLFLFPSLAEGSARVVFEALAAGLFVITTPTSGSIVVDGIHGAVVPPRSPDAIADAVRRADADRDGLATIGRKNSELVRSSYTQRHYRDGLIALYRKVSERR